MLSYLDLDIDVDCYEGDDVSQGDDKNDSDPYNTRQPPSYPTPGADVLVDSKSVLPPITSNIDQYKLSWPYTQQILDMDLDFKIGTERLAFNYQKITDSAILQILFRFMAYIEVVSMTIITILQVFVDNIVSKHNNFNDYFSFCLSRDDSNMNSSKSVSPPVVLVDTNTILHPSIPGSVQSNFSRADTKQTLDTDLHYHVGGSSADLNYCALADSVISQKILCFTGYREIVSIKSGTMSHMLVNNIISANDNVSYGLTPILIQTGTSIIKLMQCRGDSLNNRCHPMLFNLKKYDYMPILPLGMTYDDTDHDQIISERITTHVTHDVITSSRTIPSYRAQTSGQGVQQAVTFSGEETHASTHKNLGVLAEGDSGLGVFNPLSINLEITVNANTILLFDSLHIITQCIRGTFKVQFNAIAMVHPSTKCISNCFFVLICAILTQLFLFHLYYHLFP